jgi:MFS family permease
LFNNTGARGYREKLSNRNLREPNVERGFFSFPRNLSGDFQRYLFSAFAGNLALPIYALFVPLLASRFGASLFEIGLVGGASNAVYSFMPFIMGHFSDRRGSRRIFIISSFSVLSVVSISYVLISNPVYLIIARVFEGIGWAILWPAMDAAISRDVASMDPKKAFSIYNVSWSSAAAVGPLLGSALIFLTSIQDAFLLTFFIMVLTLAVNVYPSLFRRRERQNDLTFVQVSISEANDLEIAPQTTKKLDMKFYMVTCALAAASSGILFTFFAPYARSMGISILLVGVITFVFGFGRFLFYVLTVNQKVRYILLRSDKRARNMFLALVMTSVSSLLIFVRDPSGIAYVVAYAIVGIGISIVYAIAQTGIIAESSPGKFGRNAGLFESSIGVGACLGPIIGGSISGTSLAIPFLVPPIGFVIFLFAFPSLSRKTR